MPLQGTHLTDVVLLDCRNHKAQGLIDTVEVIFYNKSIGQNYHTIIEFDPDGEETGTISTIPLIGEKKRFEVKRKEEVHRKIFRWKAQLYEMSDCAIVFQTIKEWLLNIWCCLIKR